MKRTLHIQEHANYGSPKTLCGIFTSPEGVVAPGLANCPTCLGIQRAMEETALTEPVRELVAAAAAKVVDFAMIRYEAGQEERAAGELIHASLTNEARAMLEGMVAFAFCFPDPLRSRLRELADAGTKEILEREAVAAQAERSELARYLGMAARELRQ